MVEEAVVQSVQDQVLPTGDDVERPIKIAEQGANQIIFDQQQFFRINIAFAEGLHFIVHLIDRGLTYFTTRFSADHPGTAMDMVHQKTINAVGISLVFADIVHQP